MAKKKLLFVGDAACPSGFARATHAILDTLSTEYDVVVLGINYRGDPHQYAYPIFPAEVGGDAIGVHRLLWMCDLVKPDIIVIQQDGWYFPYYFSMLRSVEPTGEYRHPEIAAIPVVGAIAVDGLNFTGSWIKDVSLAIFWTEFALKEARIGGYAGPAVVIPLGVDMDTFRVVDRDGAMERQKMGMLKGKFVVGNVNRNQPRKRWDLTLRYFAEWVHSRKVDDARLFMHSAPTGDKSINVVDLARYYQILDKLILYTPEPYYGKEDEDMCDVYNCFDVLMSTTQGEGMGLTAMEAMACRVACALPDAAAFGDWAKGAAALVPCTSTAPQTFSPTVNVIGGIADQRVFVETLDALYRDADHRRIVADLGHARVAEDRFRWSHIGAAWLYALAGVLTPPVATGTQRIWQEV